MQQDGRGLASATVDWSCDVRKSGHRRARTCMLHGKRFGLQLNGNLSLSCIQFMLPHGMSTLCYLSTSLFHQTVSEFAVHIELTTVHMYMQYTSWNHMMWTKLLT